MARWSTKKGSSASKVGCVCLNCKAEFSQYKSHVDRGAGKYCSIGCRSSSKEYVAKLKESTEFMKPAQSERWSGSNNPNWRGGTAGQRAKEMARAPYKEWRKAVYDRDGYACVICHTAGDGKNLNADHIKPWLTHPELRYSVDNGRTLCVECHRATDTYGWRVYNREVKYA